MAQSYEFAMIDDNELGVPLPPLIAKMLEDYDKLHTTAYAIPIGYADEFSEITRTTSKRYSVGSGITGVGYHVYQKMPVVGRCVHCAEPRTAHVNDQCLFDHTKYDESRCHLCGSWFKYGTGPDSGVTIQVLFSKDIYFCCPCYHDRYAQMEKHIKGHGLPASVDTVITQLLFERKLELTHGNKDQP
jgi:hypothetical protein